MKDVGGVLPAHPLVAGHPDAVQAERALFTGIFFPYVALMLGPLAAGAGGAYNAWALRHRGQAVVCLLFGVLIWGLTAPLLNLVYASGVHDLTALVVLARLVALIPGIVLLRVQTPYLRGHVFLDGKLLALDRAVLIVFAISLAMPLSVQLLLLGIR